MDSQILISCFWTVSIGQVKTLTAVWAPLALPALRLVEPHFRPGAVVICDNSISSADRYADLQAYMRDPKNGYANLTVPFKNGLEMSVYLGRYGGT